ncbi:MAG: helix-turn-helix domain-containing protein [archaeon]
MDISVLFDAGLSVNEARVYMALLDLGAASVGEITKKSGVHRVNVYDVIERLMIKGLISSVMRSKKTFYEPSNPEHLLALLETKKENIREIIPELNTMYEHRQKRQAVHYFKGPEGVMTAYNMMLEQNATLYAIGGSSMNRQVLKHRHELWNKKRLEKKMHVKALYYEYLRATKKSDREQLWEIKFLPNKFKSPSMIDICGNLVVTLLPRPDKNEIMAIVINNREIAKTYRNHFNFMWQFGKK